MSNLIYNQPSVNYILYNKNTIIGRPQTLLYKQINKFGILRKSPPLL